MRGSYRPFSTERRRGSGEVTPAREVAKTIRERRVPWSRQYQLAGKGRWTDGSADGGEPGEDVAICPEVRREERDGVPPGSGGDGGRGQWAGGACGPVG